MYFIYYDRDECLGKFSASDEYHLTKLKASSKEIRVLAGDELGNIGETTFIIDQNIPSIYYGHVTRTPKSIFIKDVKLTNFPDDTDITICYSCAGQAILHTWKHAEEDDESSLAMEHGLPAFFKGNVTATAIDASKEYRAQCQISIEGDGNDFNIPYDVFQFLIFYIVS